MALDENAAVLDELEPGWSVILALRDGRRLEGTVVSFAAGRLTLRPRSGEAAVVPASEIETVLLPTQTNGPE